MTLLWLCIAFLTGIVAADTFGGLSTPLLIAAVAAGALAYVWRRSSLRLPLMLLAAGALGAARDVAARPQADATDISRSANKTVRLTGTVAHHPDWRDDEQIVVVAAERVAIGPTTQPAHGLVRLRLSPVPEISYGQRLELQGRLELPKPGKLFDFRAYLQRHGIAVLMEYPRMKVLPTQGRQGVQGWLLDFNDRLRRTMARLLPEPHAALLAGMLLGTQSAIPAPVLADFRATGTSHLLVISGWNITVVVGATVGFLMTLGLSRRRALALSLPALVLYVLFVGASPSVVRAGVMGALVIWAGVADREAHGWTDLALACALLALLDPNVLWDTGFQLSALATAGIFAWYAPLRDWLKARVFDGPRLSGLAETLAVTLAAMTLTLPVQLHSFGTLALVAPLANVLLAPAVPLAMLFGALAAVAGLFVLPLGQLLALLAWPFTSWLLLGTRLLANIPFAAVTVAPFAGWWMWVWYAALLGLLLRRSYARTPLAGTAGS
jgi:competence protein ComEC